MSRPLRIEYPDAYYHVLNRGRGRQTIFEGENYFGEFLHTLSEAHDRFGLEIHAYCLMSNHYHLLVKTPEGNLQRCMRHLNGVYTQRYNRLKNTDGPLFRGRYKAILVDHDAYLLRLSKYIHKNPLEAGMVDRLEDYVWSSYRSYIGISAKEEWLYLHEVYGQLNTNKPVVQEYQAYINEGQIDEDLKAFYGRKRWDPIMGDERFCEGIKEFSGMETSEVAYNEKQRLRPGIGLIVETVSAYFQVSEQDIYQVKKGRGVKNQPRKLAMYLAQRIGGFRLNEIGEFFGLKGYGGVSSAIHMVKQALEQDAKLTEITNNIINRLDPSRDVNRLDPSRDE
jgi:REP element-mobilizing transposase RayT